MVVLDRLSSCLGRTVFPKSTSIDSYPNFMLLLDSSIASPSTNTRRINNAGVAGEGSREGYEATEDPEKFSQQLLKSEFSEWDNILTTNLTGQYVSALPKAYVISVIPDLYPCTAGALRASSGSLDQSLLTYSLPSRFLSTTSSLLIVLLLEAVHGDDYYHSLFKFHRISRDLAEQRTYTSSPLPPSSPSSQPAPSPPRDTPRRSFAPPRSRV